MKQVKVKSSRGSEIVLSQNESNKDITVSVNGKSGNGTPELWGIESNHLKFKIDGHEASVNFTGDNLTTVKSFIAETLDDYYHNTGFPFYIIDVGHDAYTGLNGDAIRWATEKVADKYGVNIACLSDYGIKNNPDLKSIAEQSFVQWEREKDNPYRYGYGTVGADDVLKVAEKVLMPQISELLKEREELQQSFAKAKEIGERVEIRRYVEEVNQFDNSAMMIVEYAMPDGTMELSKHPAY